MTISKERGRGGETDRQTGRQAGRQTDTDRQTERDCPLETTKHIRHRVTERAQQSTQHTKHGQNCLTKSPTSNAVTVLKLLWWSHHSHPRGRQSRRWHMWVKRWRRLQKTQNNNDASDSAGHFQTGMTP